MGVVEACVGAFIFDSKRRLFLAKSKKFKGKWVVPGGHVVFGETMEKALKREVFEETRLKIRVLRLLQANDCIFSKEFHDPRRHFIFLDFLCRALTTKAKLDERELQEFVWVNPKEALKLDLEKTTRKVIAKELV